MFNVRSTCLFLGLSLLGAAPVSMFAQASAPADQSTPAPAAAPQDQGGGGVPAATPAPAAPTWSIGPIDFSGAIDGYYSFNTEHPVDKSNELYAWNTPTNTFSLNMVKFALSHTADPVGFEFDMLYGNAATAIGGAAGSDSFFDKNVEQAYVSFKPAKAKGFEIDFGKFVTTSGAEVVEDWSNFNYSHSLLYTFAIPIFHFGVRTSWPMGKHLTAGAQVVNGWNNDFSANSRATLGANIMATYSKWSLMEDWYGGPDNEPVYGETGSTKGWRHVFDTVFTLTPSSKVSAYINYDYGMNRNYGESFTTFLPSDTSKTFFKDGSLARWQGIAAAVKYQATSKWAFTPRFEVYDDASGFTMLGQDVAASTFTGVGTPDGGINTVPIRQTVKEITVTGEYKILEGLLWRGEYRYDWSNEPFFVRGIGTAPLCSEGLGTVAACPNGYGLQNSKDQNTITISFIGFFGPKR